MCEVPLTPEQRIFAAEHHDLVYRYLRENHLPEDDYYDVVIFGYLKAVRDYLSRDELQNYSFTTVGWIAMSRSLSRHYKKILRRKQIAEFVSIPTGTQSDQLSLVEHASNPDDLMLQLEMELLLHDLATRLTKQQMNLIHLRKDGYTLQDIAQNQKLSLRYVKKLLEEARLILLELCNE